MLDEQLMDRNTRIKTLLVCCGVIFTDMLGYGIITPSIPIFAKLLKASEAEIGFAFSAYPVAFLIVVLPFGRLVDRVRRKNFIIALGMFLLFISSLFLIFAKSILILSLARAFQGMASAVSWVAAQPLAAQCTEGWEKKGIQLSLVSTAYGLGMIAGPLIGSLNPFELPFIICAVIAFLLSAFSFFAIKPGVKEPEVQKGSISALLQKDGIILGCIIILYAYICVGMVELLFPLYMDSLSFKKYEIGILFGVIAIVLTICQPLIGIWINRSGPYRPMYTALVLTGISLFLLVKTSSFLFWVPVAGVLGFCLGALVTTSMYLIAVSSRTGEQGLAYGLWNLSFSIGYLIGPVGGGVISNYFGIPVPFFITAILAVPILLLGLRFNPALREKGLIR